MPLLSDLMNPSYLLLLGVFVFSIALMYLYFENKMREQNHKISSMLSLVSSLAEEMNALRFSAVRGGVGGGTGGGVAVTSYPQRLTVSDDEEEEDDEDEDEEEDSDIESLNDDDVVEEDDDDDEDDDDEGDDDEDDDNINSGLYTDNTVHMIEIGDSLNVKILKLNNQQQQQEQEFDLDNLEEIEDDDDDEDDDIDVDIDELSVESSSDDDKENTNQTPLINLDDLKSINISNLDINNNNNNNDESPMIEYKKLSVTKLRSIAQEKGLIEDASKLKKQELIDLLHL